MLRRCSKGKARPLVTAATDGGKGGLGEEDKGKGGVKEREWDGGSEVGY